MFKIYDLNYNEIRFPVDDLGFGLKSLDIDIGPILYENIYTQSSRADKLVKRYPKDRTVTLHAMFTSYNKNVADWRLKRDVIYEFFRTLGVFYVAEVYQPFKLLKVLVDTDYLPDRPVNIWGMLEIPLKIIDTPFKQSLHTTADIDSEGVRWNDKWGYGMGLSSEREQWKYSFEPEPITVSLNSNLFERGSIFLSNGQNADSNTQLGRLKSMYSVQKGQKYKLNLNETGGTINYIRIFHYDSAGNKISDEGTNNVNGNGSTSHEFTATGSSIRLLLYAAGSAQVNVGGIGTVTQISLDGFLNINHTFNFYNAGTEEVKLIQQKESEVTLHVISATSNPETSVNPINVTFELGGWWGSTGEKVTGNNPTQIRSVSPYDVVPGMTLRTPPNNLYEYNVLLFKGDTSLGWGEWLEFGATYTFNDNYTARISVQRKDKAAISTTDLNTVSSLIRSIEGMSVSDTIEIYDGKTRFTLNQNIKSGDVLKLKGNLIELNGNNVLGKTNRGFLTINKGWNHWEIKGLTQFDLDISYRFLYD